MSDTPSTTVEFADTMSSLMYSIAGWLLIGLGLFAILGALRGLIQTLGSAEMFVPLLLLGFAFVFITSGVFVNPSFRRRLNRRHNPSRFGRIRTVDNRIFYSSEDIKETCVSCDSDIMEGLVRRYREEYAIAGVPIQTMSEDHNYYCATCAMEETSGPSQAMSAESATNKQLATEIE